jgi:hypothetical protein
MVALWSAHHDPDDTTMMDISTASIGNILQYPNSNSEALSFYNYINDGSISTGHGLNPVTGLPC